MEGTPTPSGRTDGQLTVELDRNRWDRRKFDLSEEQAERDDLVCRELGILNRME